MYRSVRRIMSHFIEWVSELVGECVWVCDWLKYWLGGWAVEQEVGRVFWRVIVCAGKWLGKRKSVWLGV